MRPGRRENRVQEITLALHEKSFGRCDAEKVVHVALFNRSHSTTNPSLDATRLQRLRDRLGGHLALHDESHARCDAVVSLTLGISLGSHSTTNPSFDATGRLRGKITGN